MSQRSVRAQSLVLFTVVAAAVFVSAQPPPGCSTCAKCPVTGQNISLVAGTPAVNFTNGQQLFFSSSRAAQVYIDQPREYWLDPHSMPLPGMDGKRGLPVVSQPTQSASTACASLCGLAAPTGSLSGAVARAWLTSCSFVCCIGRARKAGVCVSRIGRAAYDRHADSAHPPQARTGRLFLLFRLRHRLVRLRLG